MTPPALLDAARAAPALETASFSTILRICNYIERGNTISTDYMLAVGELALSFISNPNARMGASAVCTRFVALLALTKWDEAIELETFPGFINMIHGASVRLETEKEADPDHRDWRQYVKPELWAMQLCRAVTESNSDMKQACAMIDCLELYLTDDDRAMVATALDGKSAATFASVAEALRKSGADEVVDSMSTDFISALAESKKNDDGFLAELAVTLKASLKDEMLEHVMEAFTSLLGKFGEPNARKLIKALWHLVFADRSMYEVGPAHNLAVKRVAKGLAAGAAAGAAAEFAEFVKFMATTTRAGEM